MNNNYLTTIAAYVINNLKPAFEVPPAIVEDIIRAAYAWFAEEETPSPVGKFVLISIDGCVPVGYLAYKKRDGEWYDSNNRHITGGKELIRFWRPVGLD